MIEPQKAMFLYRPSATLSQGRMIVVSSDDRGNGLFKSWPGSHGACLGHWEKLGDEEIYQCMHWLSLELAEFAGVSIRNIRDMMAENVRGFREYDNRIGRIALGRMEYF